MKALFCSLAVVTLLIMACAQTDHKSQESAMWDQYHGHCLKHAQTDSVKGSPDEEALYRECMDYFVKEDVHCPYCVVDK